MPRSYTKSVNPVRGGAGSSSVIRSEFAAIEAGFTGVEAEIDAKIATSGTYTPTYTASANIGSAVAYGTAQWMRANNAVTVSGIVTVVATTSNSTTVLDMSFPIASDITGGNDCVGSMGYGVTVGGVQGSGVVFGNSTNNRATLRWTPTSATSQTVYFIFTYVVK